MCDVIVIDTPPLLVVSDAFPLLDQTSGVVGIARLDTTPRGAVTRMAEVTRTAGGRLLGMVATGGEQGRRYEYGYAYGYGYEYGEPLPTTPSLSARPGPVAGNGQAPRRSDQARPRSKAARR
jgi:Mrp family chromosome partitioning ATPase